MRISRTKKRIVAANVFEDNMDMELDDAGLSDQIEDIQDTVEDIQDSIDDIEQDDVQIDIDNNITDHLIAECCSCKGIFISAMIASDQSVDSINGVCPLCNRETEQALRWVVKSYPET